MQQSKSTKYPFLYAIWGVLFLTTIVLGFAFPLAQGLGKALMVMISVIFFIPPWMILRKAERDGSTKHRTIIRSLSCASLVGTLILLVLNLRSVGYSDTVGTALHAALTIVSAPMICAHVYALSLFLWACLLIGSFQKKK